MSARPEGVKKYGRREEKGTILHAAARESLGNGRVACNSLPSINYWSIQGKLVLCSVVRREQRQQASCTLSQF
jgi:hypothetical protein